MINGIKKIGMRCSIVFFQGVMNWVQLCLDIVLDLVFRVVKLGLDIEVFRLVIIDFE